MEKNIKDLETQMMYDKLLVDILPSLEHYSYLSGSEGKVFFISDDFVVKEYYFHNYVDRDMFNSYCTEIQGFSEKGLAVPKIYAWTEYKQSYHLTPRYYILEERVKGNRLFNEIIDMYPRVKDRMTSKEFHKAIYDQLKNPSLYSEVLLEYLNDVNETASKIANMSDENTENFINTLYEIYTTCYYSFPDVFEENVLFDGNKITFIDQHMRISPISSENLVEAKYNVLVDLFLLLERLTSIQSTAPLDMNYYPRVKKVKSEIEKNKYEIALKFTKKIKTTLNPKSNTRFFNPIKHFLDSNRAKMIVDELEKM